MSVKIFFCYAHADEDLLMKLKIHLSPLLNQGLIDVWHDRNISAGTDWEQEIKEQLNSAQIILLLVSPDFMASKYINNVELKRAIERHQRGEARVIPIILRPVYWREGILGQLQALPTDGKPAMSSLWYNLDEALFDVTGGIRKVVLQLGTNPVSPSEVLPSQTSKGESETVSHSTLTPPPAKPLSLVKPEDFSLLSTLTVRPSDVAFTGVVAFSPDGQTLAIGGRDKTIKLWNVRTGEPLCTFTGHSGGVVSVVAFSPDGQTLASGSFDQTIKLWNVRTGEPLRTFTGHSSGVASVAFSPDGQTLAIESGDQTIKLWNVGTGKLLRTLRRASSLDMKLDENSVAVWYVAFSPDGQTLASGSTDGTDETIKLWNVGTGKLLRTLNAHGLLGKIFAYSDTVWYVAFSPDGQTLASISTDQTIKLWNVGTGKKVHTLTGHTHRVASVAFSPDGQTLASGGGDKTIKLWNVRTGESLRTFTGHSGGVVSVAFSPDGQTLASVSTDQTIKIWGKK